MLFEVISEWGIPAAESEGSEMWEAFPWENKKDLVRGSCNMCNEKLVLFATGHSWASLHPCFPTENSGGAFFVSQVFGDYFINSVTWWIWTLQKMLLKQIT